MVVVIVALLAAALAREVTKAATAWPIGSVLRMAFTVARAAARCGLGSQPKLEATRHAKASEVRLADQGSLDHSWPGPGQSAATAAGGRPGRRARPG